MTTNFIQELKWRGMLSDSTPDLETKIQAGEVHTAYVGFDPTAPSLTIGNLVSLMLLVHWQRAGHKPIVLLGGATGRIGDPSGKNAERDLKDFEELDRNLAFQAKQFEKFLDFSGEKAAVIVNNYDFYTNMNVLTFLRDVGKRLTINYMLAKDAVKSRIDGGISFTEFSYQLLQGYDFQHLYQTNNCSLQMGGSDQWGNIMSGVELTRRNLGASVHALTTPLLTKEDGTKYGKSEKGNVWLDPTMTSPYEFYQFCLNSADNQMPKLLRIFSFKTQNEIEALEAEHAEAPHLRLAQKALANELTARVHSEEALQSAIKASELMFSKDADILARLSDNDWSMVANELEKFEISAAILENGCNLVDLLTKTTTFLPSASETRREIKANALSINRKKITTHEQVFTKNDLLLDKYLLLELGKKRKAMIVVC